MKMKKLLLCSVMLLGLFVGIVNFDAVEASSNEELLVKTSKIPQEIDEFAKKDFGNLLSATLFLEGANTKTSEYELGSSFAMFDGENVENSTIFFPIFLNQRVEFLYSVRNDIVTGYTSSVSRFLIKEINDILEEVNGEPVSFHVKDSDIYFKLNDKIKKIYSAPKENTDENQNSDDIIVEENDLEIKNVSEHIDYDIQPNLEKAKVTRSTVSTASNYAMINWSIRETQSTFPWCAAYVTAAILNNKVDSRPTLARDILNYTFPKFSVAQKEATGVNQDQLLNYGRARGTNPIRTGSMLSHATVERELRKGNAIYMGTEGYSHSNSKLHKSRHAFALYGWVNSDKIRTYYLWNPWWNYPMVVQANNYPITIPVPEGVYIWDSSIYNW